MTEEKKSKGRRQAVSEPVWLTQPVIGLNELAAMWPTGKKGLCRQAEIPLRTFNAWLKLTGPITSEQLESLREAIHLSDGEIERARPTGGCLLVADTAKNVIRLYEAITHENELLACFEAVSTSSHFGGYRVLIFAVMGYTPTTILFPRGERAEAALNRHDLPGFQGPVPIPSGFARFIDGLIEDMLEHDEHGHVGCDMFRDYFSWFLTLKHGAPEEEEEEARNEEDDDIPPHLRIAIDILATSYSEDPNVQEHSRSLMPSCNPSDKDLKALLRTSFANGFLAGLRLGRE